MLDRIIKLPEVERTVGLKRSTIYKMIRQTPPGFPQQVRQTKRCVGWRESEIQTWIDSRTPPHVTA